MGTSNTPNSFFSLFLKFYGLELSRLVIYKFKKDEITIYQILSVVLHYSINLVKANTLFQLTPE